MFIVDTRFKAVLTSTHIYILEQFAANLSELFDKINIVLIFIFIKLIIVTRF